MPIIDHDYPKTSKASFGYSEFVSPCKNCNISSFCSKDTVDLKILQSDWQRALRPISQEPHFSQIWDMYRNIANNINFLYRPNTEKK